MDKVQVQKHVVIQNNRTLKSQEENSIGPITLKEMMRDIPECELFDDIREEGRGCEEVSVVVRYCI